MSEQSALHSVSEETTETYRMPTLRGITWADIRAAYAQGLDDFNSAPLYGLFFGGFYALGGLLLAYIALRLQMSYLIYPLAAGFVLIGPFVAVGLYDISRRLEAGETLNFKAILGSIFAQRSSEIGWMSFVTLFVFLMWMYQVRLLIALFLGHSSFTSLADFLRVIATTPEGLTFLAVGHVVGAILATIMFALTVVSFPLILERNRDMITAMITSCQAVIRNPGPMLGFAASIVALIALASIPAFLGLFVVLPILGHTTWHLYRRLVEPV